MKIEPIKSCIFCDEEYGGLGDEHFTCALKHPFLSLLGWGLLLIEKILWVIGWILIQLSRVPGWLRGRVELRVSRLGDKYYGEEEKNVFDKTTETISSLVLYLSPLWISFLLFRFGLLRIEDIRTIVYAIFIFLILQGFLFFQFFWKMTNR